MKKQGKKWMLVVLALLAVVTVALPLVGCKNDTVAEQTGDNTEQPAAPGTDDQGTGDGTGSGSGNQGSGDPEQPVTYTVTFDTKGGSSIVEQTVESGQKATKPADPTLENNVFDGWYSDAEFSKPYDFTTPVKGSFTLYAKWVERIEVTANNVSTVIKGLTGEGPHTLVVTGELKDLSAIKTALDEKSTAKVNLDLSKATGLTTIGRDAFSGCSSLTSITIPSEVTNIGKNAFYECSELTSIDLSKATGLTTIGDSAFRGCSGLTSINIPASVVTIGSLAFDFCSNLAKVTFAEESKLETIDAFAFFNCSELTSITIPDSVKTIGNSAFSGCSDLAEVTFGKESQLKTIGNSAFYLCRKLTSINIPEGVTTIGDWAFRECSGLTSISIPEGVTSIGEKAFNGCSGLTSITIPSSVTSIGVTAFYGCSSLEEVTMEANTPPRLGIWAFDETAGNLQILVPSGSEDTYKEKWSDYEGKIKAIEQTS